MSSARTAQAQDNTVLDSAAIYNMSLEQLMNIKSSGVSSELEALINSLIGVASKKPQSSRNSPSIVTLITQEEIEKSGARDLIDVLRLVPGIDFATDVQGVVSIGIRGNWAAEGKVLLLLDGQEMNDILFASLQFGNHFDVSQIKRIEVIRGPGSAIYGGYAEYGVISIITKNGEDLNGISANVSYGQMVKDYGQRDVTLSIGEKIQDFRFSLAGFVGQGQRSDLTYTDPGGHQYSMAGNSNLDPENLNLGLKWKKFSLRGIYDNYQTTDRSNAGEAASQAYANNFKSILLELKYDGKINDDLTIIPKFNYTDQIPWNFTGPLAKADSSGGAGLLYNKSAQRFKGNVTLSWDITKKINLIAGTEMYYDLAKTGDTSVTFTNGKHTIDYTNSAVFLQALLKSRIAKVTLGARFDDNSGYGSAFVPRLGITKKISVLNFKLLYSEAFRAPAIENIDYSANGSIKPELTHVAEFEVGYQPTSMMYLTINVFDITTKNPIVYVITNPVLQTQIYENMPEQGSKGVELDYKIKNSMGYLDFNYSFYTTAGMDVVSTNAVPLNNSMTLAFPANKFNLSASYNLSKTISLTPTLSWLGQRYGYVGNGIGGTVIQSFTPVMLANIFLLWKDLFTKGLTFGIGCYNIMNADDGFIQPYNSGHPPLPDASREFVLKLNYTLHPKKHE